MSTRGRKLNLETKKKTPSADKKNADVSISNYTKYNIENLNEIEKTQIDKLSASQWFQLGLKFQRENKQTEAMHSYRNSVLLDPESADAFNNLGVALRNLGHPEAAIASYYKSLDLTSNNHGIYSNIGNALRDLGKIKKSRSPGGSTARSCRI